MTDDKKSPLDGRIEQARVIPAQPDVLQQHHDGRGGEEVLALPQVGLLVVGRPRHRGPDHHPGERPGNAGDGEAAALQRIHQDVVH